MENDSHFGNTPESEDFSQVCTKLIAFRGTTPEQSKELAKKRLQAQKD